MTNDELLERAVTDICNDARLSAKGQHGDYFRCVVSQAMAGSRATLEAENARLAALAEWRTLLAKVGLDGNMVTNIACDGVRLFPSNPYASPVDIECAFDEAGLPVETPELRAALLAALGEKEK